MRSRVNKNPDATRRLVLLMLLSIVLAQWLVLTHVHEQNVKAADTLCTLCIIGEGFHHAVNASSLELVQPVFETFVLNLILLPVILPFSRGFRARAPPVLR